MHVRDRVDDGVACDPIVQRLAEESGPKTPMNNTIRQQYACRVVTPFLESCDGKLVYNV